LVFSSLPVLTGGAGGGALANIAKAALNAVICRVLLLLLSYADVILLLSFITLSSPFVT